MLRTARPWWPWIAALGAALVVLVIVIVLVFRGDDVRRPDRPVPAPSGPVPTVPSVGPGVDGLLAQRVGFAAEVTGGADGPLVHVTTDADSGPGSLREAVSGDAPAWVVFDSDLEIVLSSPIEVGSNKTIDGRGRAITVSAPGQQGLDVVGVSNVIIESLTLTDFGDVGETAANDMPDAIHVEGSTGVWIDHCDLSMAGDKLIDISDGSQAVTVSWNHFHDQEQTLQIGNQTTQDADADQTVTIHHNFFDHVGYRMPVVSYGWAHVFNNYYLDWELYAVRSERVARVLVENNVFEAGRSRRVALTSPQGDGCNDAGTRCDSRDGYLRAVGNTIDDAQRIRESEPDKVPDPDYSYSAERPGPELAKIVAENAGPQ